MQGGILSGKGGEETKDLLLLDVAPLTLGIETVRRGCGGKRVALDRSVVWCVACV